MAPYTAPSSSGLGRRPLTAVARVRIPSGLPRARAPDRPVGGSRRSRADAASGRRRYAPSGTDRRRKGSSDPHESSAGGRPGDPLLRRRPAPGGPRRAGHPRPASGEHPLPAPLRRAGRRVGRDRLPSPDPDLPPARRPVPPVPLEARPPVGDPRLGVPGGRLREPLSVPGHRRRPGRAAVRAGSPDGGTAPGLRPVRGGLLHRRAPAGLRRAGPRARPAGRRRLGRADGGARGDRRRRAGLLLREPRRGDRGDPVPPARPDLRLSLRDTARGEDPRVGAPPPGGHRRRPVRRRPRRRAHRAPGGHRQRPLDRLRAGGDALALRGAVLPDAAGARPARARRRRTGRLRRGLPGRAGPVRPPVRHPHALHLLVEPGAAAGRPGGLVAAPAAVLVPPRARQAEVPGRVGVRDGRLHHRHES